MLAAEGNLGFTLSTFLYLVRRSGTPLQDAAIEAACEALDAGGDSAGLGNALVEGVRARLGGASDVDGVARVVGEVLGGISVVTEFPGEDRPARIAAVRRALFGRSLPWLAVIIDRFGDGSVGPHWVMVEQFTDDVQVMDPYPWDDRDEERVIPLNDFMVQWELGGCRGILV